MLSQSSRCHLASPEHLRMDKNLGPNQSTRYVGTALQATETLEHIKKTCNLSRGRMEPVSGSFAVLKELLPPMLSL